MSERNDDATRMTLIERLKRWDDSKSWQEFFNIYWRLIYTTAIRAGLTHSEAQDVVQDTLISVTKNIGRFRADPAFGSFKGWLLNLTRWRISNRVRSRPLEELARAHRAGRYSDDTSTATEERLPDPSPGLDAVWDEEWEKSLVQAALDKLQRQVSAKHYQIFYARVIEEMPVTKVAKLLGAKVAEVYLVTHRLKPLFEKAVRELQARERDGLAG